MQKRTKLSAAAALILILLVFTAGCQAQAQKIIQKVFIPVAQQAPEGLREATAEVDPGPEKYLYPPPKVGDTPKAEDPPKAGEPAAATPFSAAPTEKPVQPAATEAFQPTQAAVTPIPTAAPVSASGLPADRWQEWPVIPVVSARAREIYRQGVKAGNKPQRFSKVGDCQNIRQYFLGMFEDPQFFKLGRTYSYLEPAIAYFRGSWDRLSEAVRTGFNVASVLTPLYANPKTCPAGETPLQCEYNAWKPSIMLISMETWTAGRPTQAYENYLRQIIEYALSQKVLPILATKADNLEGDHSINLTVARLAVEYDIPLWNFWRAVQSLPNKGLKEDGFHLTHASNFFDDPYSMSMAWPVRNLTALQVLDAVWRAVK